MNNDLKDLMKALAKSSASILWVLTMMWVLAHVYYRDTRSYIDDLETRLAYLEEIVKEYPDESINVAPGDAVGYENQ